MFSRIRPVRRIVLTPPERARFSAYSALYFEQIPFGMNRDILKTSTLCGAKNSNHTVDVSSLTWPRLDKCRTVFCSTYSNFRTSLTLTTLWANSTENKLMTFFLFFPQKTGNIKYSFLGENKKNNSKCHLLKILPRAISVNMPIMVPEYL